MQSGKLAAAVGALALAGAIGGAAAFLASRARAPERLGWVVPAGDEEAEVIVHAGDVVRAGERAGSVLLGPIRLDLAPGAEIQLVSATAACLLAGRVDARSSGGLRFTLAFPATATAAPVLLPETVARAALALTPEGAEVSARSGAIDFGPIRLAPGERALARPGAAPEKVPR